MKIRPIGNRAVIKLEKIKTTKSGFIVSLEEKNEQTIGEVVSVGKGFDSKDGNIGEIDIKVKDTVLVSKYGGETIKDDNDDTIEYKIVELKDIIAIIEK